ncbi:DUF1203 domain-containing protein [Roseibium sediminis]|uniref:DUF1203 domain-containing protein n=1 Tax=Roseibium sediminis TaxID=1775174 RepID=UPI00123CDD1E|nr:DUF1203 domain-containing protein [Roseibium sediminis]
MSFRFIPLAAADFSYLNGLSFAELAARAVDIHISDGKCPCRVSLQDAPAGERVFLVNHEHQSAHSPYRSRHAIYVRENAQEATVAPGVVPAMIAERLLSVRAFNTQGRIVEADVVDGSVVDAEIIRQFANPDADYLHVHFARPGCFAARVERS